MDEFDELDPVVEVDMWTSPSGLLCASTVVDGEVFEVLVHDPEAPQ